MKWKGLLHFINDEFTLFYKNANFTRFMKDALKRFSEIESTIYVTYESVRFEFLSNAPKSLFFHRLSTLIKIKNTSKSTLSEIFYGFFVGLSYMFWFYLSNYADSFHNL